MSREPRLSVGQIACATAGIAMSAVTAAVALSSPSPGDRALVAFARALAVAVPVAVGLYAWRRDPGNRFGRLLIAVGLVWSVSLLSESGDEVLYSIGRVAAWLIEPALIYVVLAFPSGRLASRVERWLVAVTALAVALLFLPTALLVEHYPEPSPWASCGRDCPQNAFMVTSTEPAFVDDVLRPLRESVAALLFTGVIVVLASRIRSASRLARRTLTPVLVVAILRYAIMVVYMLLLRRVAPESLTAEALGWVFSMSVPLMALGFLAGLIRQRLLVAEALQRLSLQLRHHPTRDGLQRLLAEAVDDPLLELAYKVPGNGWVSGAGLPVQLPPDGRERCVTEVDGDGRAVAAVIHDAALRDHGAYVGAVASFAITAVENQRLAAGLDASMRDLRESRARVLSVADAERRRIERDLHDGAQQRLVALRIKLQLAEELMQTDPARGTQVLHDLGGEAEDAIDEVRSLARGVYPPLLADRGLAEALRGVARRAPLPTTVDVDGLGRHPAEIENAVYFSCLEALQNASKHADGATRVSISVTEGDALRFEVADDGPGFSEAERGAGAGLANMRDRLAAVGGVLAVSSAAGEGTRVSGRIPLGDQRLSR